MIHEELFDYTVPAGETPSEGVIKTIATLEDCEPTALETPLYSVVDPDALDQLFARNGQAGDGRAVGVEFEYLDYEVTVLGTGTIRVGPAATHTTENAA